MLSGVRYMEGSRRSRPGSGPPAEARTLTLSVVFREFPSPRDKHGERRARTILARASCNLPKRRQWRRQKERGASSPTATFARFRLCVSMVSAPWRAPAEARKKKPRSGGYAIRGRVRELARHVTGQSAMVPPRLVLHCSAAATAAIKRAPAETDALSLITKALQLPIYRWRLPPRRHWFPPWNRRSPAPRERGFSMRAILHGRILSSKESSKKGERRLAWS